MGKDVGIVRVDMIFKGHVSKTETMEDLEKAQELR